MSKGVLLGRAYPLGATVYPHGVNFSVFSRNCAAIELLLFENPAYAVPTHVIPLDPKRNRTFYYWHIFVEGLRAGQLYGYRADGPFDPAQGLRFDRTKVLLDPYARAVANDENYFRQAAKSSGDNCAFALKSVVVDPRGFYWEGDALLQRPYAHSILYELHVGDFTRHPNSGVEAEKRGTFAGLIEKIPYLQDLGVTAVELLPVQQFDEQDAPPGLSNDWGYSPIAFFAPHRGYSMRKDPLGALDEFRKMVKALHRAGIEVILDVVFNHTAEGDEDGPTLSFRGLENRAYYLLNPSDRARYADYTGCGNTLNANHSIVRRLILDCLRYWVQAMHVDGFRFDLASVMSRDEEGQPLKNPPILWEIESDPVLAEAKIIAEAWDAAGLYQVGTFIGHRWAEWNGQFRDEVRRFVKGDEGMVGRLAQRITGSRDLYRQPDREPNRSVNFITCHDGFTLNDLVSYNVRHNQANALDNHDGVDLNHSWNCGVEGPTADPAIEALRLRQMKNLLTILLTSQGTPMLMMGDEARRTQSGNNNAFCQNNALSWFDWEDLQRNADLHRFTRALIRFYQRYSLFHEEHFWADPGSPEVTWHGVKLNQPDWNDYSHSLAYELRYPEKGEHLYVALNAYWEALEFELPPIGFPSVPRSSVNAGGWRRFVDTSLPSPEDCCAAASLPPVEGNRYLVQPHSAVILLDC